MNDEEFQQQKKRLQDLSDQWVGPLGLAWWTIELAYARTDYQLPEGNVDTNKSLAFCSADWRYGHACITWNMPRVAEQSDEQLEMSFVHELMHIFLNEMRWARPDDADHIDHEERVASTLAKAFLWQRDMSMPANELTGGPRDL